MTDRTSIRWLNPSYPKLDSYWHFHPEIEISYVQRGRGKLFAGDGQVDYRDGDLAIFGKNLPHDRVSDRYITDENVIVLQFDANILGQLPEMKQLIKYLEATEYGYRYASVPSVYMEYLQHFEEMSALDRLLGLLDLLRELSGSSEEEVLSTVHFGDKVSSLEGETRLSRVIRYISENLYSELTLQKISYVSGLAPNSFCRWFKESTGDSFMERVQKRRVERACQLLLQKDLQISEIAFKTGFESISNFNRTFRKVMSTSPSAYRKNWKNGIGRKKNSPLEEQAITLS